MKPARRAIVAALLLAAACEKPAAPPAAPAASGPTAEESAAFARRIEQAAASGDAAALNALFDWNAVLDECLKGFPQTTTEERQFAQGVRHGASKNAVSLAQNIVAAVEAGGNYRFLRVRTHRGEPSLLFRLVGPSGLNYHDLLVKKGSSGNLRIVDLYVHLAGERLSETFQRMIMPMWADYNQGFLDRLTGKEQMYLKSIPTIQLLARSVQQREGAQGLETYGMLPDEVRRMKTVMIMRLQAALLVSDEAYGAAIADYQRAFPGDSSLDLICLDGLVLQRKFDEALEGIERLNASLGGDPYLDLFRCGVRMEQKRLPEAGAAARALAEAEPNLRAGHEAMITVALARKDFDEVVRRLAILRDDLGAELVDLETVPAYAEFVASPQYKAWRQGR